MSQQKSMIALAICVFGLVGMASAQSLNWDTCQREGRKSVDEYTVCVRRASNKFVSGMQDTVESSTDISAFQGQIDELVSAAQSMMNQGTTIDAGQWSNTYMKMIQTGTQMMQTAMQMYMKMPQGAMTSYMELGQSMMSCQSKVMSSMMNSCGPQLRRQVPGSSQ